MAVFIFGEIWKTDGGNSSILNLYKHRGILVAFHIFAPMDHVAFIINPKSSGKSYRPFLSELKRKVRDPNIFISDSVAATEKFIKESFAHTEIFVAVGGDGTISTVAAALVETEKILSIYPAGSGNGFARETNFTKNLDLLLEKISKKTICEVDTITVNGQLAVNMAGVGFDGKVAKEFEKTKRGFANYIKISLTVYFGFQPIFLEFFDADLKEFSGRYLMMNIANSRQFGNDAFIAPQASLTDGLADLVLVKKFPAWYAPVFAYRMFSKKLRGDRYIKFMRAAKLDVEISTKNWHLDGEYREIISPVSVCVRPKSLKILT